MKIICFYIIDLRLELARVTTVDIFYELLCIWNPEFGICYPASDAFYFMPLSPVLLIICLTRILITFLIILLSPGIVFCGTEDMKVRVFKIKNTEVRSLYPVIEYMKSSDGKITVHSNTNNIVVVDYPENLLQMEQILDEMDVPQKQVRVEVRVIDAGRMFLKEAGLVSRRSILSPDEFTRVLALVGKNRETSLSSDMQVLTLSGKPAQVFVGEKRIIGGTVDRHKGIVVEVPQTEREAGNSLEVLPRVNHDGTITVAVRPSVSEFRGTHNKFDRTLITQVTIQDGNTLVLGGVDKVETGKEQIGIPFIGPVTPGRDGKHDRRIMMYITVTAADTDRF